MTGEEPSATAGRPATGSSRWRSVVLLVLLAVVLVVLFLIAASGGGEEGSEPATISGPDAEQTTTTSTISGPRYATGDAEVIFTQDQINTYELTLVPEDLATIDATPAAEEEVLGALTFDGETIDGVGIRYKGSVGGFGGCVDAAEGGKTCTKISMQVDVNDTDPDLEFYEQRKLQFHAMNHDPTLMRERLGYWLFGEMDSPASRATHVRLVVNGEFRGLHVLVEEVDGRFTRANFEDGTGNLYKEAWPTDETGQPHPDEDYIAALRTNEDENPSAELIRSFASDIAAAPEAERGAILDRWTDTRALLAFAVVDRTIRNDDGPFHWYCLPDRPCFPHNFYWYEEPSTSTLHLIVWDLDNAFENILPGGDSPLAIKDEWGGITNDCQPFTHGVLDQRSAACDPIVAAMVAEETLFEELKSEFLAGPFSEENADRRLDEWTAQIAPIVEEEAALHADALPVAEWEAAVAELREALAFARSQ